MKKSLTHKLIKQYVIAYLWNDDVFLLPNIEIKSDWGIIKKRQAISQATHYSEQQINPTGLPDKELWALIELNKTLDKDKRAVFLFLETTSQAEKLL